jgi:SOS-response transcriptional repressor LexA
MPAADSITMRGGECLFLELALPGRPVETAGVLLLDPETDAVYLRLRRDWESIAPEEDVEVLEFLAADLELKARQMGGRRLFDYLEQNLSGAVRVSDREQVRLADFEARLNRLYRQHVEPAILEFRTHLPLYSIRAAAGLLSGEMEGKAETWMEVPGKLSPDMFLARVEGRSMEPEIPDGSLCVFRFNPHGSRKGLDLLIEKFGADTTGRYTVKRYASEKEYTEEGWTHTRVRLEPRNPEYEAWDLAPDEFRVIARFVRVLPAEE